jgi:hypothetical protein
MANPAGESNDEVLKLDFDRRLMPQFRGSVVTSDALRLVPDGRGCYTAQRLRRHLAHDILRRASRVVVLTVEGGAAVPGPTGQQLCLGPRPVDHLQTRRLQACPSASRSDCDRVYPRWKPVRAQICPNWRMLTSQMEPGRRQGWSL